MKFVNDRIAAARAGMPLHGVQPIKDPSDEIIEVHLAALKWNILQRRFGLVASDLIKLQSSSAELLELLKSNLPDKTGEAAGWNFEKAHSILHKVREILLYGWSENFSTQAIVLHFICDVIYDIISYFVCKIIQGPEHCHIDFCKRLAQCTNNKDVFLCIIAGMSVQGTCSICAPWTSMQRMPKPKDSWWMKLIPGSQGCHGVTL